MNAEDAPNNIRKLRRAKGWSGTTLGEKIGTDKTQVSKLERGERALTEDWLRRLCAALGCTIADIVKDDGYDLPPRDIKGAAVEALVEVIADTVDAAPQKPASINARECSDIAYKAAFSILKPFSDSGVLGLDPAEVARLIAGLAESIAKSGFNKN